jgi:hypothetical protein
VKAFDKFKRDKLLQTWDMRDTALHLSIVTINMHKELTNQTFWTEGWVGHRAVLTMLAKREVPDVSAGN